MIEPIWVRPGTGSIASQDVFSLAKKHDLCTIPKSPPTHRVSVSDHVSDHISDHKSPITPPGPPHCDSLTSTGHPLEHPTDDFYWFLTSPKRHRKNVDFSNPQKSTQMAESIDPVAPKVGFWTKTDNFWHPFWHRFFNDFRKWQKCEISEEYNAKRGSEPSKSIDF